ncbi:MAG: hypothetical protein JST55_02155 [Bacteroidetes bacterium]|nr:hypothetical protein [Bacteroidota bacterium]
MEENEIKKDYLFLPGVILIFLGLIICLSLWFIIIGFPLFLIGAACVGFSKKSSELKLRWILLPLGSTIIIIGIFYAVYFKSKQTTPRDILIPEGYRGKIYIIYDQPCGVEIPKENGREIYRIPSNGILICKKQQEFGTLDYNYYFVSKTGFLKLIPYKYTTDGVPNTVYIQSMSAGSAGGVNIPQHNFEDFYILNTDSTEYYYKGNYEQRIDSIKAKTLRDCIGK